MPKTTITSKVRMRKNTYGIIEGPWLIPVSESDRLLACHLLHGEHGGDTGTHWLTNLDRFKTLAEAHGWEVKYIHDPESDGPPHPVTQTSN